IVRFAEERGAPDPEAGRLLCNERLADPLTLVWVSVPITLNELAPHLGDQRLHPAQCDRGGPPGTGGEVWLAQVIPGRADFSGRPNPIQLDQAIASRPHALRAPASSIGALTAGCPDDQHVRSA